MELEHAESGDLNRCHFYWGDCSTYCVHGWLSVGLLRVRIRVRFQLEPSFEKGRRLCR